MLAQQLRQLDGFVRVPAALSPVGCGDADEQRQMVRPLCAHRVHNLQHEAGAVVEAAAVVVGAAIRERRQEFVKQVAVRRVNLDDVESRLERPARGRRKASITASMPAWSSASGTAIVAAQKPPRLAQPAATALGRSTSARRL